MGDLKGLRDSRGLGFLACMVGRAGGMKALGGDTVGVGLTGAGESLSDKTRRKGRGWGVSDGRLVANRWS